MSAFPAELGCPLFSVHSRVFAQSVATANGTVCPFQLAVVVNGTYVLESRSNIGSGIGSAFRKSGGDPVVHRLRGRDRCPGGCLSTAPLNHRWRPKSTAFCPTMIASGPAAARSWRTAETMLRLC